MHADPSEHANHRALDNGFDTTERPISFINILVLVHVFVLEVWLVLDTVVLDIIMLTQV